MENQVEKIIPTIPWNRKSVLIFAAIVFSLVAMYGPNVVNNVQNLLNPYVFNNDSRIYIPTMFQFVDSDILPKSYDLNHHYNHSPIGYRGIYALTAPWIDPVYSSKILSILLLIAGLIPFTLIAYRLGGAIAVWASLTLFFSYGIEVSGLPRAFAFPILAWATLGLVYGRVMIIATMTVLGAFFYPTSGVTSGMMLFSALFLLPKIDQGTGQNYSISKKRTILAGAFFLSVAILSPALFLSFDDGRLLTSADCAQYPEISEEGRYGSSGVCASQPLLPRAVIEESKHAISDYFGGVPWSQTLRRLGYFKLKLLSGFSRDGLLTIPLWILTLAGTSLFYSNNIAVRRISWLMIAGCAGYVIAEPVSPYLYRPERYIQVPVTLFFLLMFPPSLIRVTTYISTKRPNSWFKHPQAPSVVVIFTVGVCLLFMGGRGNRFLGMDKNLSGEDEVIMIQYIKTLPKDTLLAGWPRGFVESIPYTAKRSIFISKETHAVLFKNYADVMRKRMYAMVDAYFSTTSAPLKRLHNEFGVSYLVVEDFYLHKQSGNYFAPFTEYIREKMEEMEEPGSEVMRQLPHAQVFSAGSRVVLDLSLVK
jgi:hypothetical protein